jgi:RNA polymerase sigma-70 factor, ECF subfamily
MHRGAELDALIARAQAGEVRAFEELLAAHLPVVRRFALAFARDEQAADDLAQDALVRVFRGIRAFRYQSAFSTWLYAVVRSAYLDAAKSRAGRERALLEPLPADHAEHGSEEPGADERIAGEEERLRLWSAIRRVPLEYRAALVLFDIEGCSYDEVAAIEGVAIGTVKSRLFRARAHLRRLLGSSEAVEEWAPSSPAASGTSCSLDSSHTRRSGA